MKLLSDTCRLTIRLLTTTQVSPHEVTTPLFGAPPAGRALEVKYDNCLLKTIGARKSGVLDGAFHINSDAGTIRVGKIVDDCLITGLKLGSRSPSKCVN